MTIELRGLAESLNQIAEILEGGGTDLDALIRLRNRNNGSDTTPEREALARLLSAEIMMAEQRQQSGDPGLTHPAPVPSRQLFPTQLSPPCPPSGR